MDQPSLVEGSPAIQLSIPEEGLQFAGMLVRWPRSEDLDALAAAFAEPEMRVPAGLPMYNRDELAAVVTQMPTLAASGRLAGLVVLDEQSGSVLGGASLQRLDAERAIVEIGYFLFPRARGCGRATRVARALAEHAFSLGVKRVEAYVTVGNDASERVLERAGFTREGVVRSLPDPDGTRLDKTLYSLLPGE
jgi:RimJ/RimL family protein N-acetyltransferase